MSRVDSSLIQKWCRQQRFVNRKIFRNKSSVLYWIRDEHLKAQVGTQPHIMVSWANLAKKEYSIIIDDFEDTNSDIHSYRFLL